jgi:hypothetical protein
MIRALIFWLHRRVRNWFEPEVRVVKNPNDQRKFG